MPTFRVVRQTSALRLTFALLASGLGVVGTSCSLALDLERTQCDSDAECADRGFANSQCVSNVCAPLAESGGAGGMGGSGAEGGTGGDVDPEWACLGNFKTPVPPAGEPIAYRFRFEKATQANVPPPDISIQLCGILDSSCLNPDASIPQPDRDGRVQLDLPANFEGYLEVSGVGEVDEPGSDLKPTLVFLPSIVILPPNEEVIRVVTNDEFASLVIASGKVYDDTRGFSVMLAKNCFDERSAGVKFVTDKGDDKTETYYFNGALPDFDALQTDEQGAGGFISLPLGNITSEARLADTDALIGRGGFYSRPNYLTYVPLGPTP